jgi:hypothetical protein
MNDPVEKWAKTESFTEKEMKMGNKLCIPREMEIK